VPARLNRPITRGIVRCCSSARRSGARRRRRCGSRRSRTRTALGTALPQRRKDRPSAHSLTSIELIDTAENVRSSAPWGWRPTRQWAALSSGPPGVAAGSFWFASEPCCRMRSAGIWPSSALSPQRAAMARQSCSRSSLTNRMIAFRRRRGSPRRPCSPICGCQGRDRSNRETHPCLAPLVEKIGATSIAEIEKMIGELQAAKDFLESEGERVQRETEHYTTLTQMASASVKIISDTVAGWREAGHPVRNHSRSPQFDLTLPSADDNTGSARVPDQQHGPSQRQIRARTRGKQPPEMASARNNHRQLSYPAFPPKPC
jgi:hypothetical protein